MRRSILAAVLLLLATSAAATDVYVPAGGRGSRTELRISNPSSARAIVTVSCSVGFQPASRPKAGWKPTLHDAEVVLDAGQTLRWLLEPSAEIDVLRIRAATPIDVTAVSHCEDCGASVTVPVLDARDAVDEGSVPMRAQLPWRGAMLVVNPGDGDALVTVSIQRGEELVDQSLLRIPARGTRRVLLDRAGGHRLSVRSTRPLLLFRYDSNEQTGVRVFATGGKRRSVRSGPSPPPVSEPQTIVLTPSKDNTLYESNNGTLSNGAGVHLFAGATGSRSLRRALLAFDVASQIPPGSRITRATLTLRVSLSIAGVQRMALHRVTADWGQGASDTGPVRDGIGSAARTGDATWVHRFLPDQRWTTRGGDFDPAPDATVTAIDPVIWESSEAMVARVQGWLDQPATNFGWIVLGNETQSTTAKRFDSREIDSAETRPALTIEFVR